MSDEQQEKRQEPIGPDELWAGDVPALMAVAVNVGLVVVELRAIRGELAAMRRGYRQ